MTSASKIDQQIGAYRVVSLLGQCGMGSVYRAEHLLTGDVWAVKLLADELATELPIERGRARDLETDGKS